MDFGVGKKRISIALCLFAAGLIFLSGCTRILQEPQPEPFVGQNAPPPPKEFRWSNGDSPKTFDPAKAVASPETDFVRQMFDGLTDLDAKTLKPVPAVASQWEASEDHRTWTFYLRKNVRWTNGKPVTADDFVRSWRRVLETGDKENARLFQNIVGAGLIQSSKFKVQSSKSETDGAESETINEQTWFGAEKLDDSALRVWLVEPDEDFPALAAHPSFRPTSGGNDDFDKLDAASKIVTNGAFRVVAADKTGVALESNKNYWNAAAVNLERVRIVPMKNADAALAAYRAGELDAVTNAKFEPLAVKLLASYRDFRREAFNAVTFFEFNPKREIFADRRIRSALSMAVDRQRLTVDELDGAAMPAGHLLPHSADDSPDYEFKPDDARRLLAEAGFKNGENFPKLKLLINRSDAQRRIARAVAAQWKRHLGIEIDIAVSSFEELESNLKNGDFDLVRRSRVFPTTDEIANLQLLFEPENEFDEADQNSLDSVSTENPAENSVPQEVPKIAGIEMPRPVSNVKDANVAIETGRLPDATKILNHETAIKEFPVIPLFYPLTYALVKPYVKNFETNMLDAPQLKTVEIESDWQR